MVYMNGSTDYLELYAIIVGAASPVVVADQTMMSGMLISAAG